MYDRWVLSIFPFAWELYGDIRTTGTLYLRINSSTAPLNSFELRAIVAGKLEYTTETAHYFEEEVRDGRRSKFTKAFGLDPTSKVID